MKKLDLYFFPQCPFCQVVLSALRVTGLESSVEYYDVVDDAHARQKLIADTGRATVPCLYIDGVPMHESKDIADWLHKYAREIQADGRALSGNP